MSPIVPQQADRVRQALGASLVLVALAGCQGSPLSSPTISSTPVATPIVVSNSPIPATPTPRRLDPQANEARRGEVNAIISKARKGYPGHSAVVFIDLESDTRVEFEPNARFESASLAKLVVLAELYRQFQVGDHTPEETLPLLESQKRQGSGSLKDAKEGSQHSLQSLAVLMITESDNTATQMLTDLLGRERIEEGAKSLGLTGTTLDRDIFDFAAIDEGRDNYITANDAASFLQQLAREELPGSQQMNEILERQKRNDMIGKNFPSTVRVAHKTGELDGILNDAAIVYAPKGNFILIALSDGVTDKEAAKKAWSEMAADILKLYTEPSSSPTPGSSSSAP